MPNDLSWYERLRGKRMHDIELPNESGKVDPALQRPDVMGQFKKAGEGFRILMKRTETLKQMKGK